MLKGFISNLFLHSSRPNNLVRRNMLFRHYAVCFLYSSRSKNHCFDTDSFYKSLKEYEKIFRDLTLSLSLLIICIYDVAKKEFYQEVYRHSTWSYFWNLHRQIFHNGMGTSNIPCRSIRLYPFHHICLDRHIHLQYRFMFHDRLIWRRAKINW